MINLRSITIAGFVFAATAWMIHAAGGKLDNKTVVTGDAAFVDYQSQKTGTFRKITAADLPKPFATSSSSNAATMVTRPADAWPKAPAGFKVELYATGLDMPRQIRVAPNGDFFVAESQLGQIKVFRGRDKAGKPEQVSVFATGLKRPFGVAFYPPGANPQWVYVGNTDSVVRFRYQNGDLKAGAASEVIVPELPSGGGHWTRDVVFSRDGKQMFVAVGSGSNVDDPDTHPRELHRANILEYTPEGKFVGIYASGIRNPVGLAINPETGELWTSINERDTYGDNLVPDYVTHVERGGFYGWPWFYIGGNYDPAHEGKHTELKSKEIVPDVLVQPHSASLGMAFYDGKQFPKEYSGDAFAAEHGSWNHAAGSGHEVIRIPLEKGRASGVYEDFLTGFATKGVVWGRAVGIAVARDGSLLVTDDGA